MVSLHFYFPKQYQLYFSFFWLKIRKAWISFFINIRNKQKVSKRKELVSTITFTMMPTADYIVSKTVQIISGGATDECTFIYNFL